MEKMKMETKDLVQENIEKLAEIFPGVITEARDEKGNPIKAVDFELLKQELSDRVVEGDRERYQLTWPGKKEAMLLANTPINKTLRPVKEESVDWETTGKLYIEGDNLEALKILQESYLNKIKCIYIDPPYNTGKDFIYRDNFKQSKEEYLADSGQVDGDGNRLFQNTESNGRFHSDWLSMMYPRLKLARNLLREDGVIFISIDDNEVHNLRKICDEIFGERNFVSTIIWHKKYAASNDAKGIPPMHDYLLVYQKTDLFNRFLLPRTKKQDKLYKYDDEDGKGKWRPDNLSVKTISQDYIYAIENPKTGEKYYPPRGRCWLTNKETVEKWIKEGRVFFGKNGDGAPQLKRYLSEVQQGIVPTSYWPYGEVGHTDSSRKELKRLFDQNPPFDNPKPTDLIKRVLYISTSKNDIILDFFSGSATTAHAVMQLNAEDGGNRKYIMVQLPEPCDEKSEAYKAGFKNISEIGKERIRRAAKKIKEETSADIDYGFRVFKVDSSNMKDVYYRPAELSQQQLEMMVSNIKEDRTGEDLLIQVMLEWGLELSLPMEKRDISGKKVHFVAGNSLVACFDEDVSEELVREIAREKPLRVVFRDSSFADDAARINVEELFKMLSPSTEVKVI